MATLFLVLLTNATPLSCSYHSPRSHFVTQQEAHTTFPSFPAICQLLPISDLAQERVRHNTPVHLSAPPEAAATG